MSHHERTMKRREFVQGAATAATAAAGVFTFVPGSALGLNGAEPANERLNLACVGVGGRGASNLNEVKSQNIIAMCDVDETRAAKSFQEHPKAKKFKDFRKMLDAVENEIDAVVVATPDHTHSVVAMNAIKRGKHVYCEKPLAHSIGEVRALVQAARQHKVATQLGNQGHSSHHIRLLCEWIWDGAIGPVREVHALCDSSYSRISQIETALQGEPEPPTLDWDLWLGPAARRPYHSLYLPSSWRRWSAFGTGAIGDWVCHIIDPVFWALNLGAPTSIRATTPDYDPSLHGESFPRSPKVEYEFPARGAEHPPVRIVWHGGDQKPPRPKDLEENRKLPDKGAVVLGDRGTITYGSHGASSCRIVPETKMKAYELPPQTLKRSAGHHKEWIAACKGGKPAESNFDYGGPLTEIALLGAIAMRFPGQKLEWDGPKARFTNCDAANAFVAPPFREGWSL